MLCTAAACALDQFTLPIVPSTLVLHGVLSASAPAQRIVLERTITGELAIPIVVPYESAEPILSDYGNAESDAVTQLTTPSGQTIAGREVRTFSGDGHGAGLYEFALAGSSLVPGGRYRLRVVTKRQEVVTAETTVPSTTPVSTGTTVTLDRSRDTIALQWASVAQARGYQVRVESPFGPWLAFVDDTHLSIAGSLRNLFVDNLPSLFQPGFRQAVTVSAVDSNMYDYYRSSNNAFTGTGVISRVSGATGFFGSFVILARRTVDVTAPTTRPIEGTFDLQERLGGFYGGVADARSITLYVESPAARAGQPDAVTGSYRRAGGSSAAAIGTLGNSHLKLVFLSDQFLTDTLESFVADLHADSLVGTFSKGAPATYVRRP
ncbi:MAG TPA: DUF4249 family protein [Gemmatimonadaceae bacterium]|nr:DUF4249 family protein [Gemmatimonadaceae bacterium]